MDMVFFKKQWRKILLTIGIILVAGLILAAQHGAVTSQSSSDLFIRQYGHDCQNRPVSFTAAPMAMNQLGFIQPLGSMSDSHVTPTDHLYFIAPDIRSLDAAGNNYPVYMPGDGTVVEIQEMPTQFNGDKKGITLPPEDHFIVISHSCRYFSIFIHVHKLAPALAAAAGILEPNQNKSVSVPLKAGDMVGSIGVGFDWIPVDTEHTLSGFIHPELYASEPWKIHVFDPFTLYSGELKTQLLAKNLRAAEPRAGKIDYDQPGKLIGNWFREGSGRYTGSGDRPWDGHLSIVPNHIDPNSTIVSIGNWDGASKQFVVRNPVRPSEGSVSTGMVKYELLEIKYLTASVKEWPDRNGYSPWWSDWNGYAAGLHPSQDTALIGTIAFQVLPGEKLKVEKFPGKTAAQITGFTNNAQMYER
jgi:hypothetical protein